MSLFLASRSSQHWVDRLKARLVAKGYTQIFGLDYSDTFSPVAKVAFVRLFLSVAMATCELVWVKQLLKELKFGEISKMELVCDNQVALHIASNPVFHERIKHIEIDCHFVREKILSGDIVTKFVKSNDQLANIFTKSLTGSRISYMCNKLGTYDVYAPA